MLTISENTPPVNRKISEKKVNGYFNIYLNWKNQHSQSSHTPEKIGLDWSDRSKTAIDFFFNFPGLNRLNPFFKAQTYALTFLSLSFWSLGGVKRTFARK